MFSCFCSSFFTYLISLVQSGCSFATSNSAFYSVNFFHNSCDVPNPLTVVLLKPFWKAARESLLILFHLKRDSLSDLNIYMLLFLGLLESMIVCPISEMSVSVLFLSPASCVLMRPVILGGVTLISRIRIFLLGVKPTNMVPDQQG